MSVINPMNGRVFPEVNDPDFIYKVNMFHHALASEQVELDEDQKECLYKNLWELYE